jgi:hypothetical protein
MPISKGYDGGIRWQAIEAINSANVHGVRKCPRGFVAWALQHGAVSRFEATMSKITWRAPDPWQPLLKGGC